MTSPSIRLKIEVEKILQDPPAGIICYPLDDSLIHLTAEIKGPVDTPYHGGTFRLDIQIPEGYPIYPPKIRYVTPIYHPNIDSQGRICLNILKSQEKGWTPALNLSTTLVSIMVLMADPNPDDPLDADIANEYKENRELFLMKAREATAKHAIKKDDVFISDESSAVINNSSTSSDAPSTVVESFSSSSSSLNTFLSPHPPTKSTILETKSTNLSAITHSFQSTAPLLSSSTLSSQPGNKPAPLSLSLSRKKLSTTASIPQPKVAAISLSPNVPLGSTTRLKQLMNAPLMETKLPLSECNSNSNSSTIEPSTIIEVTNYNSLSSPITPSTSKIVFTKKEENEVVNQRDRKRGFLSLKNKDGIKRTKVKHDS